MEAVEEMPSVVSAGCVLHNFCLLADDSDGADSDGDDQPDQALPQAVTKRNMMVQYLSSI